MSFSDEFKSTEAEENSFALIPEGTYLAELGDCKLDMTKTVATLTFVYTILDEDFKGRKMFGNYKLEGRGIGFLKKDLKQLNLNYDNVQSPEDLAALVWGAMPFKVELYCKHNESGGKTYANAYLNGLSSAAPGAKSDTNDEIPF